jgi:hypothetical protein
MNGVLTVENNPATKPGPVVLKAKRSLRIVNGAIYSSAPGIYRLAGLDLAWWTGYRIRLKALNLVKDFLAFSQSTTFDYSKKEFSHLNALLGDVVNQLFILIRKDEMDDLSYYRKAWLIRQLKEVAEDLQDLWEDWCSDLDEEFVQQLFDSKRRAEAGETVAHDVFWNRVNVSA